MGLLIKNGEIITSKKRYFSDIYCENEKITSIGKDIVAKKDDTVIDAKGKLVFPGFIDPHVHIYLPFMGTFAKDTYESAGKGALVGGTTTLIEMLCPSKDEDPLEAFEIWNNKAKDITPLDYTFHMGISRFDEDVEKKLKTIVKEKGISSFKIFLAYKGAFGINDEELYKVLKLAKKLGVIVTAHCENAELVAQLQKKLVEEGKIGPEWHEPSRPVQVEAEGCHHLLSFAEMTETSVYIVHTSCELAVQTIKKAKDRNVKAWIETVIPYLVLDNKYAEKENFEGAKFVMSPPIRSKDNQKALWKHLADRTISTVGTDHAPFDFETQKQMGNPDKNKNLDANFKNTNKVGNFTQIPNGIPSVEDRVNLLYTYGVCTNKIDIHTFVDCASTQSAKIFGLYPQKGEIMIGSDADLVIYDPNYKGKISANTQHMDADYSGFEGVKISGKPSHVTVRGKIMVKNGKFVGKLGHGKLLKREPNHF